MDIKRFYFPHKYKFKCLECGKEIVYDFEDDYISYPVVNKKSTLYLICNYCNAEYEIDYELRIDIEFYDKTFKRLI